MSEIIINKGNINEVRYSVESNSIGSEKQINWANQIKANKISDVMMMISQHGIKVKDQAIEIADKINAVVDAKFWIDNRNNSWKEIVKSI